jgi:hypothetical protein
LVTAAAAPSVKQEVRLYIPLLQAQSLVNYKFFENKLKMSKPPAPKKTRVGHQTVDLYQFVIDDTVSRVKGEFVQEGIAE